MFTRRYAKAATVVITGGPFHRILFCWIFHSPAFRCLSRNGAWSNPAI